MRQVACSSSGLAVSAVPSERVPHSLSPLPRGGEGQGEGRPHAKFRNPHPLPLPNAGEGTRIQESLPEARNVFAKSGTAPLVVFLLVLTCVSRPVESEDPLFPSAPLGGPQIASDATFEHILLGDSNVDMPLGAGTIKLVSSSAAEPLHFLVTGQQVGMPITQPIFITPATRLRWSWKKSQGTVCIVQLQLTHPETGQRRYLGYGAGAWSEPVSPDPTVEYFVAAELPREWTTVERNVFDDMHKLLGWDSAQITEFYVSPWEGASAQFRQATLTDVSAQDLQALMRRHELTLAAQVGSGAYQPLRLKDRNEQHVARFDASFEECAPGRNSAANEWSTFGAVGNMDFNAIGRDMHVRYPAFDLVFRLDDGQQEIKPDSLRQLPLGPGRRSPAGDLGRLGARRPALQGLGDDRAQRRARQLRSLQTAGPEPSVASHCRAN